MMTPAMKWKEYFVREFGFNSVQFNNKIGYQHIIENIEIKPYFLFTGQNF